LEPELEKVFQTCSGDTKICGQTPLVQDSAVEK
jgi:hypothetical protein